MHTHSLKEIQAALLSGEYTTVSIVENYLQRCVEINEHNAYIELFDDEILNQAKILDEKIKSAPGTLGPLFGAVISIKDNLCYKGHIATASSKILDGFTAPYSATVVERLVAADALIIGRTNSDEFSMGSTNESSYYGPAKNALDSRRVAGGSTGGGAVAVALKTCLVSIGSDTGGSIRQPAAYNGVIGYKPTYGTVSRWGLIAYGSSLDVIGLIAHTIQDIEVVMETISGPDKHDSTSIELETSAENNIKENPQISIAYSSKILNHPSISPQIKEKATAYVERLKNEGYKLEDVDLEYEAYYVPTYYILACAEASSNLSRFDGIRYGHRASAIEDDYKALMKTSRTEGFGTEVKKRIMLGTYVLSEGYYDAYFKKAQQVRALIKNRTEEILQTHDYLLLPTTTSLPGLIGEETDPLETYLSDICTVLANLCGIPAISYVVDNMKGNLPFSMQLLTTSKQDNNLLSFANRFMAE